MVESETGDPGVGVVVITTFEDDDAVFAAMRAPARGYVLKSADAEEVLGIVLHAVSSGEDHFRSKIAKRLMSFFSVSKPTAPSEAFSELTAREREVLDLIARGHNNAQIARRLFVSPKTVRNHISNVFAKLRVADRAQAIVRARQAGLGQEE